MANVKEGTATDMDGIRQSGAAQQSKLAKLNYQELLETRVLESAGVRHQIKHASIFDRDDTMRVATTSESFELSSQEITAIQDRIIATSLPAGDAKSPIKVQGKEYSIRSVTNDVLVAKSGNYHVVATVTASLVLVILTGTENVEPIVTIARSFTEGLSQQAV